MSQRRANYRILTVSDKVEPRIYGPSIRKSVGVVDFIIACGDLPYYYLEYIVSMMDRQLYFVHGNHDRPEYRSDNTVVNEPPGAINLHSRVLNINGLLVLGLEGSHRYNSNPNYQYTQNRMWLQVISLAPTLLMNHALYGRSIDIFVSHSPPFGIHDDKDRPHIGFKAFLAVLNWFKPRYMFHGHQHVYLPNQQTHTRYGDTEIHNIYPMQVLDLEF